MSYRGYYSRTLHALAGSSGSVSGWFTDTGGSGAGNHGASCTPQSAKCVCTDLHKCTPNVKIGGVNLFQQGWLPQSAGQCRPDLSVYGTNYFDPASCAPNTYGGPAKSGPFNISCTPGVAGIGGGYGGGGSGTSPSGSSTSSSSTPTTTNGTATTSSTTSAAPSGISGILSNKTALIAIGLIIVVLIFVSR